MHFGRPGLPYPILPYPVPFQRPSCARVETTTSPRARSAQSVEPQKRETLQEGLLLSTTR